VGRRSRHRVQGRCNPIELTFATVKHRTKVTNAALRRGEEEVLAHLWPSHHENVNFYGTHSVDVDGELAKLDADGYRPLRPTAIPAGPRPGGTAERR